MFKSLLETIELDLFEILLSKLRLKVETLISINESSCMLKLFKAFCASYLQMILQMSFDDEQNSIKNRFPSFAQDTEDFLKFYGNIC
jgi:hypothetical protein